MKLATFLWKWNTWMSTFNQFLDMNNKRKVSWNQKEKESVEIKFLLNISLQKEILYYKFQNKISSKKEDIGFDQK